MKNAKKFISVLFNTAAVAGFVLAVTVVAAGVYISYHFIDTVAEESHAEKKKPESGVSLVELSEKLSSFNAVDVIVQDMSKTQIPSICKIICDQSHFDFQAAEGSAKENPVLYISDFYKQEHRRAFADPKFRLALETTLVYSGLFSPEARQTLSEFGRVTTHFREMNEVQKVLVSTKLPVMALKAGTQLAMHLDELQARANRATELTQLRESCSGGKAKDVVRECESL